MYFNVHLQSNVVLSCMISRLCSLQKKAFNTDCKVEVVGVERAQWLISKQARLTVIQTQKGDAQSLSLSIKNTPSSIQREQ